MSKVWEFTCKHCGAVHEISKDDNGKFEIELTKVPTKKEDDGKKGSEGKSDLDAFLESL